MLNMKKEALIIMTKNPIKGQVKTRLSETLGPDTTFEIYKRLLKITQQITENLPIDKHLFYSDFIVLQDEFSTEEYQKHVQISHPNLGNKMLAAFQQMFNLGYEKCVIIGSDCPYLSASLISEAFVKLTETDVVIGPSVDGGFYLLGCKNDRDLNFDNIIWSTDMVTNQLLINIDKDGLSRLLLPILEDIDDNASWENYLEHLKRQE